MPFRADRLQEIREKQGMSQRTLAKLCQFSDNQFHFYESGKRDPSVGHLAIMADKLGVSADYLLGLTDQPNGVAFGTDLTVLERDMLLAFRRKGWNGLLRLMVEHLDD